MKRLLVFLCIFSLISCSSISNKTRNLVGKQVPNVHLSLLDGDFIPLRRFIGKPYVLFFWATWCSHSKGVINELNEYARRHPNVDIYAVSIDHYEDLQTLKNMVYLQGLDNLKHAFSGDYIRDEAYLAFHAIAVPTLVVIAADGTIRGVGNNINIVKKYFGK